MRQNNPEMDFRMLIITIRTFLCSLSLRNHNIQCKFLRHKLS
jgi:hypothetical protein